VELLQEWFVLMRERSQLSRYEKELMVRAKELEYEDTHARLQLELRDRMAKDGNQTLTSFRLLDSVETWLLSAIFQVFHPLTTVR